ncbi:MAG: CRISPR-associated helicase Cas3' [bacterium]
MSLFDIGDNYYSHPAYPLAKHVNNMIASFNDEIHRMACAYHDSGKLSKEFQKYIRELEDSKKTKHAFLSAIFFLINNGCVINERTFSIFLSIMKHHGNLENVDELANSLSTKSYIEENYTDTQERIEHISSITGKNSEFNLDKIINLFDSDSGSFVSDHHFDRDISLYFKIKEVFSKLIFSDKYEAIFKNRYSIESFTKSKDYIRKLLVVINSKKNKLSKIRNQARNEIIDKYKIDKEKKIFLIEAPTGIGKTYIALQLALEIVKDKNKKRIINALPMTSIIDQTFEEYNKIIDDCELLKYHYLTNSKNYRDEEVNEEQAENEYRLRQQNEYLNSSWALDKVIVTTFNQIFNLFFSNRNRELIKFWTLRDSVIIMDEIQSIPRILLKDISIIINYLAKVFNVDFILMSATIPAIKKYLDLELTLDLLDNCYYSLDSNNRYSLVLNESINNLDILADEILEQSKRVNSVLCIVNTKKLSLELFEKLENSFDEDELFLLNTNFIPRHRKSIIEEVKKRLEKGASKKTVLIATQVIEAGVDLDFDMGFREFAPLSSIIQSAGRINRENRESNKKISRLIITAKIGKSPYHIKDTSYEEVKQLLSNVIREKDILPFLKKYFKIIIDKTRPDPILEKKIKKLEFQDVFEDFSNNFMKETPFQISLFIEYEDGLYDKFNSGFENLLYKLTKAKNLEEKMDIKSKLKELYKKVSQYVINVNFEDGRHFDNFYKDSEMKWCPSQYVQDGSKYCAKKGWINRDHTAFF